MHLLFLLSRIECHEFHSELSEREQQARLNNGVTIHGQLEANELTSISLYLLFPLLTPDWCQP